MLLKIILFTHQYFVLKTEAIKMSLKIPNKYIFLGFRSFEMIKMYLIN